MTQERFLPAFWRSGMDANVQPNPLQRTRQDMEMVPVFEWRNMDTHAKIPFENAAVIFMFQQYRNQGYVTAVEEMAKKNVPSLHPETRVGVVVPAYNGLYGIETFLDSVAAQSKSSRPNTWSLLFVLTHPDRNTDEDLPDEENLQVTAQVIDTFRTEHPNLQISYVETRPPASVAGVGVARMIGHDVLLYASLSRDTNERTGTFYVQTMDLDSILHPDYMETLVQTVESSMDGSDVIREHGEFSIKDKIRYPLLNVLEPLRNHALSAAARNTHNPWTTGNGTLLQVYPHAIAGGAFRRDSDESLRLGIDLVQRRPITYIDILQRHPDDYTVGEVQEPLFTMSSHQEVAMITHVKAALAENPHILPRSIQQLATGSILPNTSEPLPPIREANASWLDSADSFEKALPQKEIAMLLNAWWHFLRTEYSLDALKSTTETTQALYDSFIRGDITYHQMKGSFMYLEHMMYLDSLFVRQQDNFVQLGLGMARKVATHDITTIAESMGIAVEVDDVDPFSDTENLVQPFRVVSTEGLREQLKAKLAT